MTQNSLTVRIVFDELKSTKMIQVWRYLIQFDSGIPISKVIEQVQAKVPESVKSGSKPEDYGLFRQNPEDESLGCWLNNQASLGDYSIKQGDDIILKNVNRILRFKLPDDSMKTIMVDERKYMGEIFKTICARSGISNVDEYGLAIEQFDVGDKSLGHAGDKRTLAATGTMTGKKKGTGIGLSMKKIEEREARKLEKMKQKLHTDDDVLWIDNDKTLAEQGVDSSHILSLRRRLFYESNRNVLDPFELHILYKQCEDSVMSGTLMVNETEAVQLAALSLKIQCDVFDEAKFKNVDLTNYLPREYHGNIRTLKKRIREEYIKLNDVNDFNCKQQYTALVQNSKMYGITIFLVKEKSPGKQKLTPILLGITKEAVMRLDEKTKDVLKSWPLTYVRRWAGSPNSFTFDFGEYDDNYSVSTPDSNKISQLISSYIDLILKKKKAQAYDISSAGVALVEENITPGQGVFISTGGQPGVATSQPVDARGKMSERVGGIKSGPGGAGMGANTRLYGRGKVLRTKQSQYPKFSTPKKAFIYKLNQLKEGLPTIDEELISTEVADQNIGSAGSAESYLLLKKHLLNSAINSLAYSMTNIMVNSQEIDKIDYNLLTNNTAEANDAFLRIIDSLKDYGLYCSEDERAAMDERLKELLKHFKMAFDAYTVSGDDVVAINKEEFNKAFDLTSKDLKELSKLLGLEEDNDKLYDVIVSRVKNLSAASAKLIAESQKVSAQCSNAELKNKIDQNTQHVRNQVGCMVTAFPLLALTLNEDQNYELYLKMCDELERKLSFLVGSCEENKEYRDFSELKRSDEEMLKIIEDLRQQVMGARNAYEPEEETKRLLFKIIQNIDESDTEDIDIEELKTRSKTLTLTLGKLLTSIKNEINNEQDEKIKHDLFLAAKSLADCTKNLLDNAKYLQGEDSDLDKGKQTYNEILGQLNSILANRYVNEFDALKALILKKRVEKAISATVTMDSAMKRGMESCRSEALENSLYDNSEDLMRSLQQLVDSFKGFTDNSGSVYYTEDLIRCSRGHCLIAKVAINTSKDAVPLLADFDHSSSLNKAVKTFETAIANLENIVSQHEVLSDESKASNAAQRIADVLKGLEIMRNLVSSGKMAKFPLERKEEYDAKLMTLYREIMKLQSQLTDPHYNEDMTNIADTLEKLSLLYHDLLNPLYGSAACSMNDPALTVECLKLIDNIMNVMNSTKLSCSKAVIMYENEETTISDDLLTALKNNCEAMLKIFENLPTNKDLEKSLKIIEDINKKYDSKAARSFDQHEDKVFFEQSKMSEYNE